MVDIKLAGIPIRLNNRYTDVALLCRGYETEEPARLTVTVSTEEIEAERRSQSYAFSEGYLESVCLYRKLSLELLQFDVFILHASVVAVDGAGYAFLAASGTGKTTQTRLWLEHFGSRARVINGDKPLVRRMADGSFVAYGTPWCGKEGMGCNDCVPLKTLFLVERAAQPGCESAAEEECVDRLFHQLLMPEHPEQMDRLLTLADGLVETVPAYILRCNMELGSVVTAYRAAADIGKSGSR